MITKLLRNVIDKELQRDYNYRQYKRALTERDLIEVAENSMIAVMHADSSVIFTCSDFCRA